MDKIIRNLIIFVSIVVFCCACVIVAFLYIYPLKYREDITHGSITFGIAPEIIASIINAESKFNPNAVSNVGAIGLMQVMPTTAQEMANKLNIAYSDELLFDPHYNIYIGTAYIKTLLDRFGNLDTAICAYNAGPNRVRIWLQDTKYSANGVQLSSTPYPATNFYLDKVKKNISIYSKLF